MKKLAFLYKVCTKLDFEQLFSSRLDWRPVTEESQLNAWARAGKQIKLFMFCSFAFLFCHVINILLTERRSVWENLDRGRQYQRPTEQSNNTKENFLWEPEKMNVKLHKITSYTNFQNFNCVFTILLKFDIHFLGLPWEIFFGVIT